MARRPDPSRDLLFALLSLQNGLIDQTQLVAAFHAWSRAKGRPMAEVLVAQGALDDDQCALLNGLALQHLKKHGGDPEASLAALGVGASTRESLARIGDPDIQATLARVSSAQGHAPADDADDRTATYSVGTATGDGQRFRVLRPHARGGLGAVFVALDQELHREVALKQILDHHADDPVSRQRFLTEAEITGGLEHPSIVPVYGLGTYGDGRPYYAMRFIRGDSLKDAIAAFHSGDHPGRDPGARSLALRNLLRRFTDVCNAIGYAHGRGVLHRDLKPGNVILGKHGETLVVDWGLAKSVGRTDAGPATDERTLVPSSADGSAETLPGKPIGTPGYMSPEQARGDLERLGPASDVYSLGATLYCVLTGRAPFGGGDLGALLRAVEKGDFPAPRRVDPSVDRALEAVCLKAMALKPGDRYASPRALADDVERWTAGEPVSAYAEPWGARARRWARRHHTAVVTSAWLTAASVVALACGLVLLQAKQRETESARREAVAARKEAEADFARALDAVDAMLVRVSQKHLVNLPHFEPVRRRLLEDALTFYQGFLARGGDNPKVILPAARAYRVAGDIHSQLGQFDLARRELDRAASLLDRAPAGPDRDFERASVLCTLSVTLYHQKREQEAVKVLREGLAMLGPGSDPPPGVRSPRAALFLKSRMLTWMGGNLSIAGRISEAREALGQARSVLERLLKERSDDEDVRFQLSAVEHNAAYVDLGQADYAAGLERVNHSLRLMHEIRASSPDAVHYRHDQANSFGLKGSLLERRGRTTEALEAHRRCIVLFGGLVADYPSVVSYRLQLVASHHNLGDSLERAGRYGMAGDEFRRSIEALDALTAREPANPSYLRDKANSHMHLALCLKSLRRFEESEREFLRARVLFTEVARLRPDEPTSPLSLAAFEHNRAEALAQEGRAGEAESGFRRSIELLSGLTAKAPDNPAYLKDLANSRLWFGRLLTARGARDQGVSELSMALKIWDGLLTRVPRNTEYLALRARTLLFLGRFDDAVSAAEALADLSEPGGDRHYDAACVLAFALPRPGPAASLGPAIPADRAAEFADRAMRHLRRAVVDRGDLTRESLEAESDLDALRARTDFPALYDLILDRGFPADPFAP